jgi:caffeoyl-CoA O-methyltransferase
MADPSSRAGVRYADPELLAWLERVHVAHDSGLERAFRSPEQDGIPSIMVGRSEGRALTLLLQMIGAQRAVEIGTLAGYSAIHLARGLRAGGRLETIELDPRHAQIARGNLAAAGVADRVEVHEGAALEVLARLEARGPFDAVFVDADKGNYDHYGRWAAKNLRPGGLLIGDNAFYFGKLLDRDDPAAAAMRRFHEEAAKAFDSVCLPTPDGMLLALKRS